MEGSQRRDTLRVFLQEGGSFKAAAEKLTLQKNTSSTGYARPRRASAVPSARTACNIELALLAIQWLGATVLQ